MTGAAVRPSPTGTRILTALFAATAAATAVYLGRGNDLSLGGWAACGLAAAVGIAVTAVWRRRTSWGLTILVSVLGVVSDLSFGDLPGPRTAFVLALLAGAAATESASSVGLRLREGGTSAGARSRR